MATKLTHLAVQSARANGKRREIADITGGLFLIVQPSGSKSWALRFRGRDGRPAKLTLGSLDPTGKETVAEPAFGDSLTLGQARTLAIKVNTERQLGTDIAAKYRGEASKRAVAAKQVRSIALGETLDDATFTGAAIEFYRYYQTKWSERPRRWREDARLLGLRWSASADPLKEPEIAKGSLADTWATKPVAEIRKADIISMVDKAMRSGVPGLAKGIQGLSSSRGRKLHSAMSSLFHWLEKRDKVPVNPCRNAWRPPAPQARERFFDDAEIRLFWQACDAVREVDGKPMPVLRSPYSQLFKFLLLSGCRRDEAARIRYDEIKNGVLVLPGKRTKNHVEHQLPLPPFALDILNSVPRIERHHLLFGSVGDKVLSDFSRVKLEFDEEIERQARQAGITFKPWRVHDLRRSFSSGLQRLGISFEVNEACMNHIIRGPAGVYQRDAQTDAKRDALQRWSNHVERLVSGTPDNLADLDAARKKRKA